MAFNGGSIMSLKIVVLYPRPVDPAAFEAVYHGEHMPLMRRKSRQTLPSTPPPSPRTMPPAVWTRAARC